jgi:hypothetical protein
VKADRAFSMAAIRLSERKSSIVAADATAHAGEGLAGCIVTRATTKTICFAEIDQWRILKGRTERGLIVPCRLSWDWVSHAEISLEDDIAGALFELPFAAPTEEEC